MVIFKKEKFTTFRMRGLTESDRVLIREELDKTWQSGGTGREALREEVYADLNAPYAKDINRLTSSWHPTGKVLFQDDMESLIANATNHYRQTGGTISRANDRSFHGQYALKLTTGAVAGNIAEAAMYISLPNYLTKIGLELKWLSDADISNLRMFKIAMTRYDEVLAHNCDIRYYGTLAGVVMRRWQYLNQAGGLSDIFTQHIRLAAAEPAWNGVKIIADFEKDTYDTFISNELSKDMKGIPFNTVASTVEPELGIYITIMTETNTAINAWLDDLILTDEGE